MSQMTNSQARVVDPILTAIAQGYSNLEPVGAYLFPRVPVRARAGRIITFGKEDFMLYSNLQRAPGQNTKRVQFGYAGSPFLLADYSLEGQVPVETEQEAQAVPGIDIAQRTVVGVQNIIANRLEVAQATLATTAGNYGSGNKVTLSGSAQWSDPTSTPFSDVQTAKEAIRAQTGHYPNVMVLGPTVFSSLQVHPQIIARLTPLSQSKPDFVMLTEQILAALFGIATVKVGMSVSASDAGVFSDSWGKFAVLSYSALASLASQGTPSYGYTYQLEAMPLVEEPYMDRNAKSWLYPVDDAVAPVIASAPSGYLISAAVA